MISQMPHCISEYEVDDPTCDGDPDSDDKAEFSPCAFRNHCLGFQLHLQAAGKDSDDFIEIKTFNRNDDEGKPTKTHIAVPRHDPEKFMKLINDQVKRYGIEDGKATKIPRAKKKTEDGRKKLRPSKSAQMAANAANTAGAKQREANLWQLFDVLKQNLVEGMPDRIWSPGKASVLPGRLYMINRVKLGKYVSVYCKSRIGRDVAVVLVNFKPRSGTFDAELPIYHTEFEGFSDDVMDKLSPKPHVDGAFNCMLPKLDKSGVILLAETICKLVKDGKIALPSAK